MILDKKHLARLAELARIKLKPSEEEEFLKDLKSILGYFKELTELDTEDVIPMAGGTSLQNVTREDQVNENRLTGGQSTDAFPEKENGYLKIPPVFDK